MSDAPKNVANPYDMDSTTFDAEKYLDTLLRDCTLKQIMDTEAAVVKDTQTLHSDMQTLVYENYNKFISATDTIRKMKNDFKQMETDMNLLKYKMDSITTFSEQITGTLQGTRSQLCKLSEKHSLLKRLQFLSSLPYKLKSLIEEQNYVQSVQDYKHAQKVFEQYGHQPSFEGIRKDCNAIILDLKLHLRQEFQRAGKSAQSLTEIGELLLQLDEKAPNLATEMLHCASKRLHEQIVMLQDQTERDMIEFIDMGIEGFLNDLTLVVTSYFDMFVAKHYEDQGDDFQETALKELNIFLNVNIDKYLALVQDRVESDVGFGDTHVMLRALDRLHRRLLAMRNICRGIEIQRNTVDIIISAAHQLCDVHSKNLKDHFSDSLSSMRLSLVSSKSDTVPGGSLNDLITNLYVSLVEKVRGVLQDLLVFLQTNWSFNIKSDYKGTLCVEGIRENLLIGFLRHISKIMSSFGDSSTSSPPNLLLVLSKTCLEMEQNGVHILISLVDDLYEIDSENSATLTHETEICAEMRETAQSLLDAFVRIQGLNVSQMLRKSVETRDWLNCLEPRTVRAVMKRVVEELSSIETVVASLYDYPSTARTTASSDSSRKTHFSNLTISKHQFRSNWSNYTPSQLESSYVSNIHRLFSERIDIFTSVEFSKVSIVTGIIKIGLKTLLECVRLRIFSKFGLQQIQVDTHYLQMNLWRFVKDENLINFLLDEILGSAVHRCLESTLMEPNAVEIICERGETQTSLQLPFRIQQSTISKILRATIPSIYKAMNEEFMKFPQCESQWHKIALDFWNMWGFPNCLGAIDGKHCNIIGMKKSGSTYFNYKGFNSIILMGIADANYRFLYADVGMNGRIGDAGVWIRSDLKYAIENKSVNIPPPQNLPSSDKVTPFTFLSDDAFALTNYMIKPYSHRNLTEKQLHFNKMLSRNRRVVENAFGILANRFRVLFTPIHREPAEAAKIVLACVCLHNFLRTANITENNSFDQLSSNEIHLINSRSYRGMSTDRRKPQKSGEKIRDTLADYMWENQIST